MLLVIYPEAFMGVIADFLDIFKGIPLNAVLREQIRVFEKNLTKLQSEHQNLEIKNTTLQQENLSLKAKITELEKEIDEIRTSQYKNQEPFTYNHGGGDDGWMGR
jgi:hypothetical protein